MEFYAPWCGHCKNLKPDWEKAATALKGVVNVGAVDADAHKSLAAQYGIQGFPTIKLMYADSSGKVKAVDYNGGRTAKDIAAWAMGQAQKIVMARLGAKSSSSSSSGSKTGSAGSSGGSGGFYDGTDVVTLTDSDFHSQVGGSDEMWFVEFYAPWCGHCKALKSDWIELAGNLDGKVRVGAVDCTANEATCSEFSVRGFPTILFFGANKERPENYEGGRDTASLAAFATERWARELPPPEARELTDNEVWVEHCLGHEADPKLNLKAVKPKQLCLVAFLPHILDSKAAGRQEYLSMLKKVAAAYKERPFAWFWAEGGAQGKLEGAVDVGGYGYPAFVAVNPAKGKFATLRSAFQEASVKEFMDRVRMGREAVAEVKGALGEAVEARSPWDGTDGEAAVEEEFSLEDLGIGTSGDKEEL